MTRAVRVSFLCAAAALVACGRAPVRLAAPDPATVGQAGGTAEQAAQSRSEVAAELGLNTGAMQNGATVPASGANGASGAATGAVVAPASGADAAARARSGDGNALDGSEHATIGDLNLDEAALAAAAEKALGAPPAEIAGGNPAEMGARSADESPKRKGKGKGTLNALGFWGSPDVADRVYGNLGWSYANLWWDDYYGTINGNLDGRSVYLTDDVDTLRGYIGWSSVDLRRYSGWWSDTIRGYLGGHYVNITVDNGAVRGNEGNTYINTYTSWDGRSLKGSYGGYKVNVYTSGSTLTGSIGYRNVRINSGWSAKSGYIGNKSVYLQGNLSNSALLRRMSLLAANDWMIVSTLTEFFD